MLGTISATFAAFAALIATKTHGKTTAYLHVRVHTPVSCPSGQESIGVVGWSSDGCVASGGVCVANVNGACPEGAHCTMLDTGVYGCIDGIAVTANQTSCSSNEQTIGVVGWEYDGCISSSNVCVAQVSNGDCPVGTSCQKLDTGVYGCVADSKKLVHHHHKLREAAESTCPGGQESIAVEGWSADGCVVSGHVCVANVDGTCPEGAHCAWLDTGVFGCKEGAKKPVDQTSCSGSEQSIGVVGWDHDGCISSTNACVAQVSNGECPTGAYCSLLDTGVYGCIASSKH
uniref:Cysteine-rich protein n=1 Tax=Hyaloperonospora arabidopsidis (strain Emoy2) TaxID=559515 RepID=M4C4Y1_HYAAE